MRVMPSPASMALFSRSRSRCGSFLPQMHASLPDFNRDDSWTLPVPGTFIVDRSGAIQLAYADADFSHRLEPSAILDALRKLESSMGSYMDSLAIWAQLEAKPGKEQEVESFLKSALPLAEAEPQSTTWYALKLSPSEYAIFDTFANQAVMPHYPDQALRLDCETHELARMIDYFLLGVLASTIAE